LFGQTGLRIINTYTVQNGLSDNNVYSICQDSRGFLWLGTREGLNRFDGYQFKKIFASKNQATGLANNTIMDILEYRNGQLLVATASGLSVLNTLSSNFENEKIVFPELKAGSGTLVTSLFKDNGGNIWVNHSGELDILDSNLHYQYRFTDLPWAKELKGVKILWENWFTDKQHRLWLPTDTSGIQIIDFSQKKILNSHHNPQGYEFLNPRYIRSISLDESANILWYAPWGSGLYRYDLNTHTQQQQDFGSEARDESQSVNEIIKLSPEKILCAKGRGCFIVDAVSLAYKQMPPETDIGVLFKSANGNYWMGTDIGLVQLEKEGGASAQLSFTSKGTAYGGFTSVERSHSEKLYISCFNNALIEAEKDLTGYKTYSIQGGKNITLSCIQEDKAGQLWVGSSNGLYLFNESDKTFIQPKWLHPDLYNSHINFIYCDREKNMWATTREPFGIYRYEPTTGKFQKIKNSITHYFASVGETSRISYITEDDKKQLWMVSRLGGGIICYNKENDRWSIYPAGKKNRSLLTKSLARVYPDKSNNLWLYEQFGSGLINYNYQSDSMSFVTRSDGLPSDFVKSISYGSSILWVLTEYGISKFDVQSQKISFNTFFKSEPLSADAFLNFDSLSQSVICATNGQLLFYPVAGFRSEKKEKLQPLIDKVWVNSKEINENVNGQSLKLKPRQTNISIDFTVVDYSNADKIKFAYQLSGADHDWKYADASRSAQYAVLTPGTYTFRIKIADENGNWNQPYDSFSFTIVPWFWQTLTFKILLALVVSGIAFYFIRKRIKTVRHEAELKQKMTETEMMALRAQMNPHFIFNCISAIDNLIQSDQKEKATVYLTRFAKLIRSVLDNSKNNLVPFYKDYESLQLFLQLEKFRCSDKFEYRLNVDEEVLNSDIKVPPLIIQPFVENAIHHGLMNKREPDRELSIRVQLENDYLKYTITDNGVGREIAEVLQQINKPEHVSYGLDISSRRVNLHNKNNGAHPGVVVTDLKNGDVPAGTKVELWLSLK
jgi:ligand-binding sensor domain-containing protein/anti-sigma regulatory factor (Ser/Thr protein kinase)